jgi:hypothetical protein
MTNTPTKSAPATAAKGHVRQQGSPLDFLLTRSQQVAVLLSMALYFQYFVYRTERLMDSYLTQHTFLHTLRDSIAASPSIPPPPPRVLVFEPRDLSQGIGNIMNGFLAAHMLAMEFNRTLCVSKGWDQFHKAFHVTSQATVEPGQEDPCNNTRIDNEKRSAKLFICVLNYAAPPNECRLQDRLSNSTPIIFFSANTYPRWANSSTYNLVWDDLYEPREALINILPYKVRPSTVVHLRQPDDEDDKRSGLDDDTLTALGMALPNDTFLVTNNIAWYDMFQRSYGWKNPGWHTVKHSALDIMWGDRADNQEEDIEEKEGDRGILELWSDWYTILHADKVYHTHSDFSLSAIHWRDVESKTIQGVNGEGELILTDASWRVDEPMKRVVDRVGDERGSCDRMGDDEYMMFDDNEGVFDDVHDGGYRYDDDEANGMGDEGESAFQRDKLADKATPPKAKWHIPDTFLQKEKPADWTDDAEAEVMNGVPRADDEDPRQYEKR